MPGGIRRDKLGGSLGSMVMKGKSDEFHRTLHRVLLSAHPHIMAVSFHRYFDGEELLSARISFGCTLVPFRSPQRRDASQHDKSTAHGHG